MSLSNERQRKPLKYSGSLEAYNYFDVTPVIGREFPEVQLTDLLNDDVKLRDLAILGERLFDSDLWNELAANAE